MAAPNIMHQLADHITNTVVYKVLPLATVSLSLGILCDLFMVYLLMTSWNCRSTWHLDALLATIWSAALADPVTDGSASYARTHNPSRSVEECCAIGSRKSDTMALAGYVLMLFTLQVGTHNSKESEKILDQLTNLMGLSLGHVKFHENRLTIFRVILLTYRHTKTTN